MSRQAKAHRQDWRELRLTNIHLRRVWDSAVFWSWLFNGLRLAAGVLLLLPLLLKYLPSQDIGMYGHFVTLVSLLPLLDSTFSATIGRNIGYAMRGVKELQAIGIAELREDSGANLELLSDLLHTTRRLYLFLCLFLVLVLGSFGSWVLADKFNETSSAGMAVMAWAITLISSPLELYTGSWLVFLRGMNEVLLTSRLATIVYGTKTLLSALFLWRGLGLLAVPLATLITAVGQRFLAKHYCLKKLPHDLPPPEKVRAKSILLRLWPMSWRLALQLLSGFLMVNLLLKFASDRFGLSLSGVYWLSYQVIYTICLGMAGVWTLVKWPLISQLRAANDFDGLRRVFWPRIWLHLLTYILLAGAAVTIGPTLLHWWNANKELLPRPWLITLAVFTFLDMNVSIWTTLLTMENRFPSLWPVTIAQTAASVLAGVLVYKFHYGIGALIMAPLVCNAVFNFWYWPVAGARSLGRGFWEFMLKPPAQHPRPPFP